MTSCQHPACHYRSTEFVQQNRSVLEGNSQTMQDTQSDAAQGVGGLAKEVSCQGIGDVPSNWLCQNVLGRYVGGKHSHPQHWGLRRSGRSQGWYITYKSATTTLKYSHWPCHTTLSPSSTISTLYDFLNICSS